MALSSALTIRKHFGKLGDPRMRRRRRHLLLDIIVMAIGAVIGDCDNWQDIGLFVQKRKGWFQRFLALPNGVPSHDTFERVFRLLDPTAFWACFHRLVHAVS